MIKSSGDITVKAATTFNGSLEADLDITIDANLVADASINGLDFNLTGTNLYANESRMIDATGADNGSDGAKINLNFSLLIRNDGTIKSNGKNYTSGTGGEINIVTPEINGTGSFQSIGGNSALGPGRQVCYYKGGNGGSINVRSELFDNFSATRILELTPKSFRDS